MPKTKQVEQKTFYLGHFSVEASQGILIEENLGIELLSHLTLVPLLLNTISQNTT